MKFVVVLFSLIGSFAYADLDCGAVGKFSPETDLIRIQWGGEFGFPSGNDSGSYHSLGQGSFSGIDFYSVHGEFNGLVGVKGDQLVILKSGATKALTLSCTKI